MAVLKKIISGGQTGVDRAALDAALKYGTECSGWCPAGRLDEFGKIPERYPLKELESGGFAERTLKNVKDSDGSVIFHAAGLRGGTKETLTFCLKEKRPHLLIDATKMSVEEAADAIGSFVREKKVTILNLAGPRQSEWPEGYEYAFSVLERFLSSMN
jgi:hypothetical protein